ncbi:MAG: CRTAC1 family protein, partial [Acidobacteriota bacterium]
FTDVTAGSGLDDPATGATGYGMGVAAFDYDNDGWVDLYLSNFGGNQLWRNRGVSDEGRLRFDNVTEASRTDDRRWSVPALAFDYDRDGWLDLWVGNYVDARYGNHKTCMSRTAVATYCSPSIFAPVGDRLLRNLGPTAGSAGRFEDVTARLGLDRAFGPALGAIAADFDADGWLDLYVANDGQPNQLWINREGRGFSDEALLAGSAVNRDGRPEASMGVDAADFDGDGDIDLFMTHLSEETHTLYRNDGVDAAGGVTFEDVTAVTGLGQASFGPTGFGAAWLDYDNDGRLDLLAVNGAVKTVEALYRAGDAFPFHQPNQLFHQRSDGRYEDVTQRAGDAFQASYVSRGAVVGDVDNDGDPDVVVTNNNGPARLLVNRVGQAAQWLGLRLLTRSGRDALGARAALLRAGQRPLWRRVEAAGSYASSRDPRLLFGLGDAATIEAVQVHWPDGSRETWTDVATGRYTTLRQGSGHSEDRGHSQDRGRRGE